LFLKTLKEYFYIYDTRGRKIKDLSKFIIKKKISSIKVGKEFPKGIYFIKFGTESYNKIIKIIKIK